MRNCSKGNHETFLCNFGMSSKKVSTAIFTSTRCWTTTLKLTSNLPLGKLMKSERRSRLLFKENTTDLPVFQVRFTFWGCEKPQPFAEEDQGTGELTNLDVPTAIRSLGYQVEGFWLSFGRTPWCFQCLRTLYRHLLDIYYINVLFIYNVFICIHVLPGSKCKMSRMNLILGHKWRGKVQPCKIDTYCLSHTVLEKVYVACSQRIVRISWKPALTGAICHGKMERCPIARLEGVPPALISLDHSCPQGRLSNSSLGTPWTHENRPKSASLYQAAQARSQRFQLLKSAWEPLEHPFKV